MHTDHTHHSSGTDHLDQTHYEVPSPDPHLDTHPHLDLPHRRGGRVLLVLVALLAGAAVLVGAWAMSASDEIASSPDALELAGSDDELAGVADAPVESAPSTTEPTPATEPAADPQPEPVADPEPEPQPEPEPEGPCDLLAPGQVLAVTPGPVVLPIGTYAGELVITNCSDQPVPWSASTLAPSVTLGDAAGLVAGGAAVNVPYAVDKSAIVGSSMAFFIKVAEPGFETSVMVQVTKAVLNPGIVIPLPELAPNP
jgi:hypothetical protein